MNDTGIRYIGDVHVPVIQVGSCRTLNLWDDLLLSEENLMYRRLPYMNLADLQQTLEQMFMYTDHSITCDIIHLEIPTLRVYGEWDLLRIFKGKIDKTGHGRDVSKWSEYMYSKTIGIIAGYDYHKYKISKHMFEQYFDNIMRIIPKDIHVVLQTTFNIQLCDSHADQIQRKTTIPKGLYDESILTQDNRFVARERCDEYIHHSIVKHADRVSLINQKEIFRDKKSDVLLGENTEEKRVDFAHYPNSVRRTLIDYVTNNFRHLLPDSNK